jgi:hypothetical protein
MIFLTSDFVEVSCPDDILSDGFADPRTFPEDWVEGWPSIGFKSPSVALMPPGLRTTSLTQSC